jgi:hypothetical protein
LPASIGVHRLLEVDRMRGADLDRVHILPREQLLVVRRAGQAGQFGEPLGGLVHLRVNRVAQRDDLHALDGQQLPDMVPANPADPDQPDAHRLFVRHK